AHLPSATRQFLRRLRHARVLDRAYRYLRRLETGCRSLDEHVVRLGTARDEDHLRRLYADQRRDLLARHLHRPARERAELVSARCVAIASAQERHHRLEHAVIDRRRGVVIEVNVLCHARRVAQAGTVEPRFLGSRMSCTCATPVPCAASLAFCSSTSCRKLTEPR